MPTPRPLARSASSFVEKPGAQSSASRALESTWPAGTGRPAWRARAITSAASTPRPSSAISIVTSSPAADALSVMVPSGRLPCGDSFVRRLDAVADGVADQMQHRVHHPFDQILVDLRGLPLQQQGDPLAGFAGEIANHERHAPEDFADRHEADAHQSLAQGPQLSIDRDGVLLNRAPFDRRHVRLDPRQRVQQAGAADHHVADLAHQFVEARQIDADDLRWRRRESSAATSGSSNEPAAIADAAAVGATSSASTATGVALERRLQVEARWNAEDELEGDRSVGFDLWRRVRRSCRSRRDACESRRRRRPRPAVRALARRCIATT